MEELSVSEELLPTRAKHAPRTTENTSSSVLILKLEALAQSYIDQLAVTQKLHLTDTVSES